MLNVLIIAVIIFLIIISIKYEMKRALQLVIISTIILLIVYLASSYIFYQKHHVSIFEYLDYKRQAITYSKEFDPAHAYEFTALENHGCQWMTGCSVEVHLQSISSQDELVVLFQNGRLVPIARANNLVQ